MQRLVFTLAILSTFGLLTGGSSTDASAAEPAARNYSGSLANSQKAQGFTRNGKQGVGLFGDGGTRAPAWKAPSTQSNQSTYTTFHHQQVYRPQLQYAPYPMQYYNYGYGYGGYGLGGYGLYNRPVVFGNPYNSFAPASAFGFGPGAIFGW